MKKEFYVLLAVPFFPSLLLAQTGLGTLQGNDVQMGVHSNGLIGASPLAPFVVPAGDGTSPLYSAGLWIAGMDENDQPRIALHMYGANGHDFYPGPLTTDGSATITPDVMSLYDRVWLINASDIILHQNYMACLSDPGCDVANEFPGYTIPADIIHWPVHGDVLNGQDNYLAPWVDIDLEGFYDPFAGDHPCVPGDHALFMIFNDKGGPHAESLGQPLGVEVHMTAFLYAGEPHLDQTVFVRYRIINRGMHTLSGLKITSFADLDLGCPEDDLVGTDVQRNMVYVYNGNDVDLDCIGAPGYGAQPPAFGIMVLKGPLLDADGTDNAFEDALPAYNGTGFGDGIPDNERHGLANSMYYVRQGDSQLTGPATTTHFMNYMNSIWKNNVLATYGGNGYSLDENAISTQYVFPGESDPLGVGTDGEPQQPWYDTLDPVLPDPSVLATMGPITLLPGAEQEILLAYVYARAISGGAFASVEALQARADSVHAFAQTIPGVMTGASPCALYQVGVAERIGIKNDLLLYPNPVTATLTIRSEGIFNGGIIRIYDSRGALLMQQRIDRADQVVDVSALPAGLYQLRFANGRQVRTGRFVKE